VDRWPAARWANVAAGGDLLGARAFPRREDHGAARFSKLICRLGPEPSAQVRERGMQRKAADWDSRYIGRALDSW
jgi:hypothetical protein